MGGTIELTTFSPSGDPPEDTINLSFNLSSDVSVWSFPRQPTLVRLKDVNGEIPNIVRVTTRAIDGANGFDNSRISFSPNQIQFDFTNVIGSNILEFSRSGNITWDVDFAPEPQQDNLPGVAPGTGSITIAPSQLLANDTDTDLDEGEILTVTGVQSVLGGTVALSANNIVFTPQADFAGNAEFKYTVSDGNGGEAIGTAIIPIEVPNIINNNLIINANVKDFIIPSNITVQENATVTTNSGSTSNVTFQILTINRGALDNLGNLTLNLPSGFDNSPSIIIQDSNTFPKSSFVINNGKIRIITPPSPPTQVIIPVIQNAGVIDNRPLGIFNSLFGGDFSLQRANSLALASQPETFAAQISSPINPQIDNSGLFLNDGLTEGFAFNLQSGGILAGSGTFTGDPLDIRTGTLAPGGNFVLENKAYTDSNGTFTITDDFSMADEATISFSVAGTDKGDFDSVAVGGNVGLNGGQLTFEIDETALLEDIAAGETKTIELITAEQLNNALDLNQLTPADTADFDYTLLQGETGLSLQIERTVQNVINGDFGNNTLIGTNGNDRINGLGGDDLIEGKGGNDTLDGGTGKFDRLFGHGDNDTITDPDGILGAHGGSGNDTITVTFAAAWDNDTNPNNAPRSDGKITGGYGDDIITVTMNKSNFFLNMKGDEPVSNTPQDGNDVVTLLGSYGNSSVDLGGGNDTFNGGVGSDNITGGNGNDTFNGDVGSDNITGGNGSDTILGGNGVDTFRYTALSDSLLSGFDKITDLVIGTDKIDALNAVSAANFAKLGAVASLTQAGISAVLNSSYFLANRAATFSFGSQRFVALNDGVAGFFQTTDAIIEITGFSGNINNLAIV